MAAVSAGNFYRDFDMTYDDEREKILNKSYGRNGSFVLGTLLRQDLHCGGDDVRIAAW